MTVPPIPVPDPTTLTTDALQREIGSLRALLEQRISATELLDAERMKSIDLRLATVEANRVEQKVDTKVAVDAALAAQKEAVREQTNASERAIAKSEASTTKQLEQMSATFAASMGTLVTGLADLKERVGTIENVKIGGAEKVGNIGQMFAILVAVVVIAGFVLSLFALK